MRNLHLKILESKNKKSRKDLYPKILKLRNRRSTKKLYSKMLDSYAQRLESGFLIMIKFSSAKIRKISAFLSTSIYPFVFGEASIII